MRIHCPCEKNLPINIEFDPGEQSRTIACLHCYGEYGYIEEVDGVPVHRDQRWGKRISLRSDGTSSVVEDFGGG